MLVRRGQKSLNGFKFGTFIGRFPNDGVSSMAVKMLKLERKACSEKVSVTQTSLQMRGLVMAYDATNQTQRHY